MAEVFRYSPESSLVFADDVDLVLAPDEKHMHWVRWIYASINEHFTERLEDVYPVYLEGDERTLETESEFIEVRIDGPFILQPCPNMYILTVEINLLVQTHMDKEDLYKQQRAAGFIVKAFTNAICVYKLGDEDFDDGSLLGTLKVDTSLRSRVDVSNFGIIKEDTRIVQTTAEGHYQLELHV
jgi:hypothetical protein